MLNFSLWPLKLQIRRYFLGFIQLTILKRNLWELSLRRHLHLLDWRGKRTRLEACLSFMPIWKQACTPADVCFIQAALSAAISFFFDVRNCLYCSNGFFLSTGRLCHICGIENMEIFLFLPVSRHLVSLGKFVGEYLYIIAWEHARQITQGIISVWTGQLRLQLILLLFKSDVAWIKFYLVEHRKFARIL